MSYGNYTFLVVSQANLNPDLRGSFSPKRSRINKRPCSRPPPFRFPTYIFPPPDPVPLIERTFVGGGGSYGSGGKPTGAFPCFLENTGMLNPGTFQREMFFNISRHFSSEKPRWPPGSGPPQDRIEAYQPEMFPD